MCIRAGIIILTILGSRAPPLGDPTESPPIPAPEQAGSLCDVIGKNLAVVVGEARSSLLALSLDRGSAESYFHPSSLTVPVFPVSSRFFPFRSSVVGP